MKGIDIGLYDFDRHNALYYFVVTPDEQILLRYGGRDDRSPTSYLDLDSLVIALEKGLELFEQWEKGELPPYKRPEAMLPDAIPSLKKNVIDQGRCVECHLIGDYASQEEADSYGNVYEKMAARWPSPDLLKLGIELDVPKGLVIKNATMAAELGGFLAGDEILAIESDPVYTFGDLQHRLNKVRRDQESVAITVSRTSDSGDSETVELGLPLRGNWWLYDTTYRYWTEDPLLYFTERVLTAEEKVALEIPESQFACEVTKVDARSMVRKTHELKVGDIIVAYGDQNSDPVTDSCSVSVRLRLKAGETTLLDVLRDGEKIQLPLNTDRQYYRKNGPGD